jgi:signal transduction histidine kinase
MVDTDIEEVALEPEVSDALAWISRESTTNVLKHSDASRVKLSLHGIDRHAVLLVEDDGVGIGVASADTCDLHLGLQVMRERASGVGGSLHVRSSPGQGTRIECRVPLRVREN